MGTADLGTGIAEVRSQKSEVRSQKSEVRSQKSEVRSQKSNSCAYFGCETNVDVLTALATAIIQNFA
ncbi:hypothetical protein LYNGBM3L_40060 [Moorena producens 3L]|uniref:Uncharacterized protein n=2 Tax=Coleofasciculaceae TaxID=1892251 RepID=F4XVT3_9CYAN|nr:hypothetical protein LYNGBM3L_40060 [Moorena producens 3L]OLT66979.1 hypothetical protein BI334_19965 [Moorena producens 3L]